jgi:hypothetical protein
VSDDVDLALAQGPLQANPESGFEAVPLVCVNGRQFQVQINIAPALVVLNPLAEQPDISFRAEDIGSSLFDGLDLLGG